MQRYLKCVVLGIILGILGGFLLGSISKAHARDLGQNTDPVIKKWFEDLIQPDNGVASCCGEADGYWCDNVYVKGGQPFCTITDDRVIIGRAPIPVGTEIQIPPEKMLDGKVAKGNPTGHSIVFLNSGASIVYCFIMSSGV